MTWLQILKLDKWDKKQGASQACFYELGWSE